MATSKVTLKLLIDKQGKRVLFAEAGKDFVDFLFSLLVLPVGTVVKLLGNQDTFGSLTKLYESVSDLNNDYILPKQNKDIILKPKSSVLFFSPAQVPLLPIEAFSPPSPTTNSATSLYTRVSRRRVSRGSCPASNMSAGDGDAKPSGFVKGLVTYMVMDDLGVSPMPTISNITLLNKFIIKDSDALKEKVVNIGMNEGLELLKHSLNSKTVLTDVFLRKVVVENENMKRPKTEGN